MKKAKLILVGAMHTHSHIGCGVYNNNTIIMKKEEQQFDLGAASLLGSTKLDTKADSKSVELGGSVSIVI
jgi:hypothetical protein